MLIIDHKTRERAESEGEIISFRTVVTVGAHGGSQVNYGGWHNHPLMDGFSAFLLVVRVDDELSSTWRSLGKNVQTFITPQTDGQPNEHGENILLYSIQYRSARELCLLSPSVVVGRWYGWWDIGWCLSNVVVRISNAYQILKKKWNVVAIDQTMTLCYLAIYWL